jgi:O-antigen/teichoic acid export membrane protein
VKGLARNVLAGAGIITAAGVFARLLSLLSVPILSRLLGPDPYGVAALAGSLLALATVLALMGIDMAYARFALQSAEADKLEVERFCWRHAGVGAVAAAGLVSFFWAVLGGFWVKNGHERITIFLVAGTLFAVLAIMATTRMRIAGRYKLIAASSVAAGLATISVNLCLAWVGLVNEWALLGGVLAGSLATVMVLKLPSLEVLKHPSGLDLEIRRKIQVLGVAGSITAPMHWIIATSDRWFLANFSDTATVGIYVIANNLVSMALILNSSLILTWFPEASRVYAQRNDDNVKALGMLLGQLVVVLGIVWLGVCATGGSIIRIITPLEFHSGVSLIPWLAGGVFFYGVVTLTTTPFFLENKMRTVAIVWSAGALVSIVANLALTPHLGASGAAIAQCVSFGFIAICLGCLGRRVLYIPVQWVRLGISLVLTLTAAFAMYWPWSERPIWDLLVKLPILTLVAISLIGIVAPAWLRQAQLALLRLYNVRTLR